MKARKFFNLKERWNRKKQQPIVEVQAVAPDNTTALQETQEKNTPEVEKLVEIVEKPVVEPKKTVLSKKKG